MAIDYFQFCYYILFIECFEYNPINIRYELYTILYLSICTMRITNIYSYVYQPQCIHLLSCSYAELLANNTKHIYDNFKLMFIKYIYHVQMSKHIST